MSDVPVLFLIFNRPQTTGEVFAAIRRAKPRRLYIAADGPRSARPGEAELCRRARELAMSIDWDCEVHTLFRTENFGCRRAVSEAIDWFFECEEEGIILEDDCLPSPIFFDFCAELLARFRNDTRIMAICGSSYAPLDAAEDYSYTFSYYADIWGWASWRRAWQHYDSTLSRWPRYRDRDGLDQIAHGRDARKRYWTECLNRVRAGEIDTWDYQWMFAVIEQGGLACYPRTNLISNLGFGADATHTTSAAEGGAISQRALVNLALPLNHPPQPFRTSMVEDEIDRVRLGIAPGKPRRPIGTRALNMASRLLRGGLTKARAVTRRRV